jgi:hypothetical protein
MIFGRDATVTAVTCDASSECVEDGVGNNVEREWVGGSRREQKWKPDVEFRQTLEANCLEGHEHFYVRSTPAPPLLPQLRYCIWSTS